MKSLARDLIEKAREQFICRCPHTQTDSAEVTAHAYLDYEYVS